MNDAYVTPDRVNALRDACRGIAVATVNVPGRIMALLEMGIDGIMTDHPESLSVMRLSRDEANPGRRDPASGVCEKPPIPDLLGPKLAS